MNFAALLKWGRSQQILSIMLFLFPLSFSGKGWNNIQKIKVISEEACKGVCSHVEECSRWSFYKNTQLSHSDTLHLHDCFIESQELVDATDAINALLDLKQSENRVTDLKRDVLSRGYIGIQRIVSDTIATDSTSLMNHPQHFIRGCSYTISLWVWLWKSKKTNKRTNSIIFSTRDLNPSNTNKEYEPLLPAIIFNVHNRIGKLFFSGGKDRFGDYSGVSPPFILGYHEWMHITVTFGIDYLDAYVNGRHYQRTRMVPPLKGYKQCPYHLLDNPEYPYDINKLKNNTDKNITFATTSNTQLQILGGRNNPSTPGMIQDFIVFRGIALNESHINQIMNIRKPTIPPSLKKMLNLYGIYSLENYSVRPWESDFYLMIQWGVCPVSVCGPVCFDESFLLGYATYPNRLKYKSKNKNKNNKKNRIKNRIKNRNRDRMSFDKQYHDTGNFDFFTDGSYGGNTEDDYSDSEYFEKVEEKMDFGSGLESGEKERESGDDDAIDFDFNTDMDMDTDMDMEEYGYDDDDDDDYYGIEGQDLVQGPLTKEESDLIDDYNSDLDDYYNGVDEGEGDDSYSYGYSSSYSDNGYFDEHGADTYNQNNNDINNHDHRMFDSPYTDDPYAEHFHFSDSDEFSEYSDQNPKKSPKSNRIKNPKIKNPKKVDMKNKFSEVGSSGGGIEIKNKMKKGKGDIPGESMKTVEGDSETGSMEYDVSDIEWVIDLNDNIDTVVDIDIDMNNNSIRNNRNNKKNRNKDNIIPSITLPRRHALKKQTNLKKKKGRNKKVLNAKEPKYPALKHFKDFFDSEKIVNYFEKILSSFLDGTQNKNNNKKSEDEVEARKEERMKKRERKEKKIDDYNIRLLNELDADEEQYLLHDPIGKHLISTTSHSHDHYPSDSNPHFYSDTEIYSHSHFYSHSDTYSDSLFYSHFDSDSHYYIFMKDESKLCMTLL